MNTLSAQEQFPSGAKKRRDQLDEYLPSLRKALERERDFRVEQLAELAAGRAVMRRRACSPVRPARRPPFAR